MDVRDAANNASWSARTNRARRDRAGTGAVGIDVRNAAGTPIWSKP